MTDRLDRAEREYHAQLEMVGASRAVSVQLLRLETKQTQDYLTDMLRLTMTGYVLAGAAQDVELHCDTPRGWWGHTWRVASAHPYTRWGKYLHAWANRRWPDHVERTTVNRKVCPHGHTDVPRGHHLTWLADERAVQAFRWPAAQLTDQVTAGLAGMLLSEGVTYPSTDLLADLRTYGGLLVDDMHKIVGEA